VRGTTLPAQTQRLNETPGQTGPIGEVSEQPDAGVTDYARGTTG
jgi:hypothetical protein